MGKKNKVIKINEHSKTYFIIIFIGYQQMIPCSELFCSIIKGANYYYYYYYMMKL